MSNLKCDGECSRYGTCTGEIRPVKVRGNGFMGDFEFNYCETAIEQDRHNGFTVVDADADEEQETELLMEKQPE